MGVIAMSILTLYERLLGNQFEDLPAQIQNVHDKKSGLVANGRCTVVRGSNLINRLIAEIVGFPRSGIRLPVTIEIEVNDQKEKWLRDIDGYSFSSILEDDHCKSRQCLSEKFGFMKFNFLLPTTNNGLSMELICFSVFGISLPKMLWPIVKAKETVQEEKFYFDVKIVLPVTGLLVHYQGWLDVENKNKFKGEK